MLREIPAKMVNQSEPGRRWFFSNAMDLIIWNGGDGGVRAFQLAYNKTRGEHLLAWRVQDGFAHYRVDQGERHSTPLLLLDGPLDANTLLERFRGEAPLVPEPLRSFVEDRLSEFALRQIERLIERPAGIDA